MHFVIAVAAIMCLRRCGTSVLLDLFGRSTWKERNAEISRHGCAFHWFRLLNCGIRGLVESLVRAIHSQCNYIESTRALLRTSCPFLTRTRSQRFFARPRPTPSPTVTCSSAAASAPEPAAVPATLTFKDRLTAFVRPIPNDPEANKRVWALCVVQLFWSVSTLMYASYLAIYLREVLHLSNTSVRNPRGGGAGNEGFGDLQPSRSSVEPSSLFRIPLPCGALARRTSY